MTMTMIMDPMDVEMPDLPEFDMLEVVDGPNAPYPEECSSKVLEEWRKPETPLDDVVDEIMEMDVQFGGAEDLLDAKFFFNEDPCLSPTSALDDLVFANTSLDDKELTLFAYPEANEEMPPPPSVPSNIPTPPPSMSLSSFSKPKPVVTTSKPTATPTIAPRAPVARAPVAAAPVSTAPRPMPVQSRPPAPAAHAPHPYPHHAPLPPAYHHHYHPYHVPVPPPAPAPAAAPKKPAPRARSKPRQKKAPAPIKLNYTPAPPHMQPKPIAVQAAAAGAKRSAAAAAAAARAVAPKKPIAPRKPVSAPRKAPTTTPKKAPKKPAAPRTPTPAFMKEPKYQDTLQKLTESMYRSQESRKCFHMTTPKTEKYARSKSVSKVLSSIEQSTRQIHTYIQGPAYAPPVPAAASRSRTPSSSTTSHHAPPASQPPAQPRKK